MLPERQSDRACARVSEGADHCSATSTTTRATSVLVASARPWTKRVLLPALRCAPGIALIEPVLASAAPISSAIASFQPDLLLLDAALLEPAAQHLSSICAQIRPSRLVLLMDAIDSAWAKKISANGVYGVLLAGADVQHCCSALRKIGEGEAWLPRWLLGMALEHCRSHHFRECEEGPPSAVVPLTQREREIATLAAGGLSNKEIAWNAGIAVDTVKRHLKRAFAKLRVRHRGQLAARLGDLR